MVLRDFCGLIVDTTKEYQVKPLLKLEVKRQDEKDENTNQSTNKTDKEKENKNFVDKQV
ncbi:hypothetical protein [Campylobacter cuniculorum]|uniref:Uncharacterized protein n=2 Tax=Campylobacter cuniculorum TaxID=374106 RepID=A0A1W6BVR0_9BACT|nr:hypothetical protein [Campylobacter cuniculorum]ARJ56164.1 hypothetical protein CCUN_0525 [Campylobacter cuniculorum DSM 23162 = LMG 24588]QOR03656.1 hypothetical protein A0071_05510 [Campylobacter cuniculorum]